MEDSKDNQYIEGFKEALQGWTDHRLISREELETVAMFTMYLVNLADDAGWVYRGLSFKRGVALSTLVIKAMLDETAVVSFISGRTLVNCMKIFLRRMREDTVEWREDRFA